LLEPEVADAVVPGVERLEGIKSALTLLAEMEGGIILFGVVEGGSGAGFSSWVIEETLGLAGVAIPARDNLLGTLNPASRLDGTEVVGSSFQEGIAGLTPAPTLFVEEGIDSVW
jgi:hypothetical protein